MDLDQVTEGLRARVGDDGGIDATIKFVCCVCRFMLWKGILKMKVFFRVMQQFIWNEVYGHGSASFRRGRRVFQQDKL